ncbi:MAG: hypothetical protein K2H85_04885 [Allobaculum sp.]|nr:hypothetical protein [Allobaculum sp.]
MTYVVVVFAMSYIVGMAIHQVAKFLFSSLRNHKCIIKISWEKFRKANNLPFSPEEFKSDDYYEAYYTASTYSWSSVPVLESQYSFLRSMILVEIAYLISGCSIDLTACQISLIALVFIITIILAGKYLYLTSYRVWEDAYFMKKIGQKKII